MRHPTWKVILLSLGALFTSAAALKEAPRERAIDALRKEFLREGVGATRDALDAAYALACEDGYLPVCDPSRWRPEDQPTLAELRHVFEVPCAKGDPAACTVLGWVADGAAREAKSVAEGTPLYRQAARTWKSACDDGKYQPACYEYADQLFEVRGLVAEPAAGVVRWESACTAGYAPACARLADLHTHGAPGARLDVKKALSYATKACAAGDVNGCAARDVLVAPADAAAAAAAQCDNGLLAACRALPDGASRGCDLGDGAACSVAAAALAGAGDTDGALERWSVGCRQGHAESCGRLAEAVAAEPAAVKRAPAAFRAACFLAESGDACTVWGTALVNGDLPPDGTAARRALERTCEEDEGGAACLALGAGFEHGAVGERDRTLASRYYGWACAQGDLAGCERRGDLLVSGVGVRRDDAVALATFRRACEGALATSCYKAGLVLDHGTDIPRDAVQAKALYATACDGGVAEGCYGLGQLLEEGVGGPPDHLAARAAYDRALAGGSTEARGALSRLLWQGLGGPRRKGRARELAEEACQLGDRRACQGPSFL